MSKDASESYSHYYAKQVLVEWLTTARGKFFSLRWGPTARIYQEYPLVLIEGIPTSGPFDEPWDEIPSKCCTCPVVYKNGLLTSAINPCEHSFARSDQIPSREEVLAVGGKVGAIIDVVIVDEGRVKYLFEVVHTSGLSPMKQKLLCRYAEEHDAVVYELTADYLLRQIGSPQTWRARKVSLGMRPLRGKKRRGKQK